MQDYTHVDPQQIDDSLTFVHQYCGTAFKDSIMIGVYDFKWGRLGHPTCYGPHEYSLAPFLNRSIQSSCQIKHFFSRFKFVIFSSLFCCFGIV